MYMVQILVHHCTVQTRNIVSGIPCLVFFKLARDAIQLLRSTVKPKWRKRSELGSQCRRRGSTHRWCSRLRSGSSFRRPLPPPATPSTSNSASSHPTLTHPSGARALPHVGLTMATPPRHLCHLTRGFHPASTRPCRVSPATAGSHAWLMSAVAILLLLSSLGAVWALGQGVRWRNASAVAGLFSSCRDLKATVDCNDASPPHRMAWAVWIALAPVLCVGASSGVHVAGCLVESIGPWQCLRGCQSIMSWVSVIVTHRS
jgi:hypothetical protein